MCTGKVNPFMRLLVASLTLLSTLSFAQTAAAPDASGKWKVHLSVGGSDSEMECNFVQAGADLSGTCKGEAGEAKVTDAPFRLSKPDGVAQFGPLNVKRVCLLTAPGSSSGACRDPAPSPSVEH